MQTKYKKSIVSIVGLYTLLSFFSGCTKKEKLTGLVGPVISKVAVTSSSITSTSATITWVTDVRATSRVFYGTTTGFESATTETDTGSSMTKTHSVALTGLGADTEYYFYVESKDSEGNSSSVGEDGSRTFTTSSTPAGTTVYLYLDDIKIEGTGGTPVTIYDEDFSSGIFTGGQNNNIAYMGSPNNGSDNIQALDTVATDDKHGGSTSWKITLNDTAGTWWAGMYVLASGEWRSNWSSTQTAANLTGPTGTMKLTCWAKVSGTSSTKLKIGIGDNSGTTTDDSITGGKKESSKFTITSTWTQLELDLTGQDLSSINGVFLWAIDGADIN